MNPVLLRKQLQENAADLQEFCKDLKNWGEEMKRKEEALKNDGNGKSPLGGEHDHKKVKKSTYETAKKKSATKVDFNNRISDEFKITEEEGCEWNDDVNENTQDLALIEKEKGNKFIKSQKWEEAIKCYNKAIKYYANDPTFYANRALCYLKKGLYEEAEKDCTSSLKLDDTYVKAYHRRAIARESLKKLKQAEQDLIKVLEIEPKNEESRQLLNKVRQKLENIDKGIISAHDTSYEKEENEASPKKPVTKLGTTDYAAWDKFDADAECEKLEEDINDDSELTDECNDSLKDLAIEEKEKGNKFVKNQKWNEAIKCYSKAIEYYSYDPIFYANRALCYIKEGSYEKAEKDCTLSLKLNNTYVKAYQRRAAARENLNKLEHAEYDLLKVLELEPKNTESRESLEKLRQKLGNNKVLEQRPVSKFTASRNKSIVSKTSTDSLNSRTIEPVKVFDTSKPVSSWPEEENILLVKSIKKPPHMRSKKPLKRITIVEKDSTDVDSKVVTKSKPEAIKQHVFEKKEEVKPLKVDSIIKNEKSDIKETDDSVKKVSAFRKKQTERYSDKSDHSTAWPRSDQQSFSFKSDDFKIIEKAPPDLSADQHPIISKEIKNTSNISLSNENKKIEHDKSNTGFVKPKTSVQFTLTWKNLKNSEEKYKYFKQIDPQDLPKIFLNSLESHTFSDILEVLVQRFIENKDPIFNILEYFTQVKRFDTLTMFLSISDKRNLWKLFDYVKEVEQKNKEHVDRLIDKYEL